MARGVISAEEAQAAAGILDHHRKAVETLDLERITAHEERAGILEHDAGLPRPEAKFEAAKITATYVRNRGLSMVGATGGPGELPRLSQVPDTPARVDRLPLGV